ncbi:nuclear transport factor 2 family protein [Mycobacterium sp. 2YAF39]|uniref:nuclear transport factor 2 family protein n=1 Tax=Mycobacterium sp. 2YAF39 TaxID=3233033 RepID=UPI003F995BC4
MAASTDQVAALLDRERIRDCVARLARGEDRRASELIRACFWPDATIDLGIFAGSFDEYLAWVTPGSPAIRVTQHVLGQSVIEHDGETACAETHVTAYHRVAQDSGDRDTVIGARYLDRLSKRGVYWRIGHRTMVYDWYQDLGLSVDWSDGLMGVPFTAEHYIGRGVGDHSETFFGRGAEWVR